MKKSNIALLWVLAVGLFLGSFAYVKAEGDISLTIRSGDNIVFMGSIPLPGEGAININDEDGNPHEINSRSVLSVLNDADIASPDFEISNLTYFSSFGSLYLKCITHSQGEECDNWQYVVDGGTPFVSVDQNILSGGENIYLYFGLPNRITLDKNTIKTSEGVMATTENYDYENNGWIIRSGVTVGVTQPNPNDPWSPIEVITTQVDENGQAVFSNLLEGDYNVGVKEDFYFPTVSLKVEKDVVASSGGSGGGSSSKKEVSIPEIKSVFNKKKAYEFLFQNQEEDGSWGEDLYTDWVVLSIIEDPLHQSEKIKVIKFLSENPLQGDMLTDIERRSMALMAFGLSPYSTNNRNYIGEILSNFDGEQFGDVSIDNDDIFALIVLSNAGFTKNDIEVSKTIEFVLSKQRENGSWDESIDMTSAGISALSIFKEDPLVNESLERAKAFLLDNQSINGSFGNNVSSTSWTLEAIKSLGEDISDWKKSDNSPIDYIAKEQDIDGGIKNEILKNRIWETAYAVNGIGEKNWNELLQDFSKQEIKKVSKRIQASNTEKPKLEEPEQTNENQGEVLGDETMEEYIDTQETPNKTWFGRIFNKIFNIF
ncbi:MAG: terpene cyclase/mutase family protein [Candidatus Pacebacteria bacterium]|nr:terpene cyclase/mutase family protein [Candidatus Paceibacterota bacterium]MBP9839668.1 terpene cyclase/mutase family protein [Candidatus Paceibacterota bacterium]